MPYQDILAIIPARGGSKTIPHKNIVELGGKPLIAWTIEAALGAGLGRVIVSSEDKEILAPAERFGAEPLLRPLRLATDTALSESLVRHILRELERREGYRPEMIAYLQPTSPQRDAADITAALTLLGNSKADALVSVYEIENKSLKAFLPSRRGFLEPIRPSFPSANRQELPRLYMQNGAIYLVSRRAFLREGTLTPQRTIPYIMNAERSIDLDTKEHLAALRVLFRKTL